MCMLCLAFVAGIILFQGRPLVEYLKPRTRSPKIVVKLSRREPK